MSISTDEFNAELVGIALQALGRLKPMRMDQGQRRQLYQADELLRLLQSSLTHSGRGDPPMLPHEDDIKSGFIAPDYVQLMDGK